MKKSFSSFQIGENKKQPHSKDSSHSSLASSPESGFDSEEVFSFSSLSSSLQKVASKPIGSLPSTNTTTTTTTTNSSNAVKSPSLSSSPSSALEAKNPKLSSSPSISWGSFGRRNKSSYSSSHLSPNSPTLSRSSSSSSDYSDFGMGDDDELISVFDSDPTSAALARKSTDDASSTDDEDILHFSGVKYTTYDEGSQEHHQRILERVYSEDRNYFETVLKMGLLDTEFQNLFDSLTMRTSNLPELLQKGILFCQQEDRMNAINTFHRCISSKSLEEKHRLIALTWIISVYNSSRPALRARPNSLFKTLSSGHLSSTILETKKRSHSSAGIYRSGGIKPINVSISNDSFMNAFNTTRGGAHSARNRGSSTVHHYPPSSSSSGEKAHQPPLPVVVDPKVEAEIARILMETSTKYKYELFAFQVGEFYRIGRGLPKDQEKAVEWYKLALERGKHRTACLTLGLCCINGFGCKRNLLEAVKYFQRADRLRDLRASQFLKRCRRMLEYEEQHKGS